MPPFCQRSQGFHRTVGIETAVPAVDLLCLGDTEVGPAADIHTGPAAEQLHPAPFHHPVHFLVQEGTLGDLHAEGHPLFNLKKEEIVSILDPKNFTGRAPSQVTEFLNECVNPVLEANKELLGEHAELNV